MAILSTLSEFELAILTNLRTLVNLALPDKFPVSVVNQRVVNSPANDEESDLRRLEEVAKSSVPKDIPANQVALPSVVLSRVDIVDAFRKYGGREAVMATWLNPTTGLGSTVKGIPMDMSYSVRGYCASHEDYDRFFEAWLVYIMDMQKITYGSVLMPGQVMNINLQYELPQTGRIATRDERWGGKGHMYVLQCSFVASGTIIFLPSLQTVKRIMRIKEGFYTLPEDLKVNPILQNQLQPDYTQNVDSVVDSISLVDSGTQS